MNKVTMTCGSQHMVLELKEPGACTVEIQTDISNKIIVVGVDGTIREKQHPYIEFYEVYNKSVPDTHFTVGYELISRLYKKVEVLGYMIPNVGEHGSRIRPDKAVQNKFD